MSATGCCKICRFAAETTDRNTLRTVILCHRFPPVSVAVQSPQGTALMASHPPVEANGWCGEFLPHSVLLITPETVRESGKG